MTFLQGLFQLSPRLKVIVEVLWDSLALLFAVLVAYWVRIGIESWAFGTVEWLVVLANLIFTQSVLLFSGHYHQMIRYISLRALYIIFAALVASVVYLYIARILLDMFIPATVPLIYLTLAFVGLAAPRLLIQTTSQWRNYQMREKCIVYGAGESGRQLVSTLKAGNGLLPIAFVDDKKKYQGKQVLGIPVVSRAGLQELLKEHTVSKMLLAVNNTSHDRHKELIEELEPFAITLLSIPNIQDIASGKRQIDELRPIHIDDLLGRDPVPPIKELMDVDIRGKHVMVTGAGGSIGSELCRQLIKYEPAALVLFELSEFNLYQIENELSRAYPDIIIVPVLSSIQDAEVLRQCINQYKIQTIYHAAAYKHVPMVESNVFAGLRNNVFGTANVALIAAEFEVEKFVLVSTDKAVRPTNVMGATKRFAELFVQGLAELNSDTNFAIVRFGNVLGSSGSVVPLFTKQIQQGGPITVTHPDIIRYFMTIPEAAQLVIQAGAMGREGEVFVLDMGEPVKIVDLATKMAHLMGYDILQEGEEGDGIVMRFSGLRPGEKLYEELLLEDSDTETQHPRILGANEKRIPFELVVMYLDRLNLALIENNHQEAKRLLHEEVPLAYSPDEQSA